MEKFQGLKKARDLFLYSDSEPNEVMIGLCHAVALPCTLVTDIHNSSYLLAQGFTKFGVLYFLDL